MWLAKFYIERQRYREAESLFQKVLEIHEDDRSPNSYLPHHLQEFAKFYELQGKPMHSDQVLIQLEPSFVDFARRGQILRRH